MAVGGGTFNPDEIQLSDLEALGADLDAALSHEAPAPPKAAPAAPSRPQTSAPTLARFAPLAEAPRVEGSSANIDILMDVSLRVSVELGRATLTVRDTLSLSPGQVVELDKLAGDPVDVLVNGRLIARGEVVVVDDQFGVRVTEIVSARQRVEAMR